MLDEADEDEVFWKELGGKGTIPGPEVAGDDEKFEKDVLNEMKLYKCVSGHKYIH